MKIILLALVLITSCATRDEKKSSTMESTTQKVGTSISIEPQQIEIRPGEMRFLRFEDLRDGDQGDLKCGKRKIPFYRGDKALEAFVVESYFTKLKPYKCIFISNGKATTVAHFTVEKKTFPSEKLKVSKKKIYPPKKALIRIRKEQTFLNKNYEASPSGPLFTKAFKIPLNSFVTSIYGSKRLFNNKKQSQHLGTDYRAVVGTPIYAANSGKVVVSRDLYYTGSTVTIDHGVSIFTIYGHLSKTNVAEGDYIPKGALLGWSGMTGRVTGPHLHWGVKVYGNWIEGDSLVKATSWMNE